MIKKNFKLINLALFLSCGKALCVNPHVDIQASAHFEEPLSFDSVISAYSMAKDNFEDLAPNRLLHRLTDVLTADTESKLDNDSLKRIFSTGMLCIYIQRHLSGTFPYGTDMFLDSLKSKTTVAKKVKGSLKKRPKTKGKKKNKKHKKNAVSLTSNVLPFEKLELSNGTRNFVESIQDYEGRKSLVKGDKFLQKFFAPNEIQLTKDCLKLFEANLRNKFKLTEGEDLIDQPLFSEDENFLTIAILFGNGAASRKILDKAEKYYEENQVQDYIHWFQKLANSGHPEAMNNLGAFFQDLGNIQEAQAWYQKAADVGYPGAMFNLGIIFKIQDNIQESQAWFQKAVNAGYLMAMFNLGSISEYQGNIQEAHTWYQKAADAGSPEAMYSLGLILQEQGNIQEAQKWYEKAAKAGNMEPWNNLGTILQDQSYKAEAKNRKKEAENKKKEAKECYLKAANAGDTLAMGNLAIILQEQGQIEEAEEWHRKAVKSEDVKLMFNFGIFLRQQHKIEEAKEWYKKAAKAGSVNSMNNLGILFQELGQDEEAEKWYRDAVKSEDAMSMFNFGIFLGQQNRMKEARKWFEKAAEASYYQSYLLLADILPDENVEQKLALYKKAVSYGVEDAEIFYNYYLSQQNSVLASNEDSKILESEDEDSSHSEDEGRDTLSSITPLEKPLKEEDSSHSEDEGRDTLSSITPSEKPLKKEKKKKRTIVEARENLKKPVFANSINYERPRTYNDVKVQTLKAAAKEIDENLFKVQYCLSCLANGDHRRARFESLKGYDNLYSMRITQKDRLIFRITGGNIYDGVRGISILAASQHDSWKKRLDSNKFQNYVWSK